MDENGYGPTRREDTVKTEPLVDFGPGEVATTMAEFMLSPNIPESEREAFKKFAVMFNQVMALTNIKRWERVEWIIAFNEIVMLQEFGDYDTARAKMGEYLLIAQISRSIDGMNALYGMQGITRTTIEHLEPPKTKEDEPVRRGIISKIIGGLRGR
jgi:hypothetical protein